MKCKGIVEDVYTGRLISCNESKTRNDRISEVYRTIRRLRMIINANFTGSGDELFLTLTYSENMTDVRRLYRDFHNFILRLRRRYKFEYVTCVEPQQRGAWHHHVILKGVKFIDNDLVAKLWRHGFVTVRKLDHVDNVGAYVSAYLINLKGKKGARLFLYPAKMRIYRKSRGIVSPVTYADDEVTNSLLSCDNECKVYDRELRLVFSNVIFITRNKQYNYKRSSGFKQGVVRARVMTARKVCGEPVSHGVSPPTHSG